MEKSEERQDMDDYMQTQADKKLTNSPYKHYANTTDYKFSRFKIDHQDAHRDEILHQYVRKLHYAILTLSYF